METIASYSHAYFSTSKKEKALQKVLELQAYLEYNFKH